MIKGRMYENVNTSRGLQHLNICFPDSICWTILKAFFVSCKCTGDRSSKHEIWVRRIKKKKNSQKLPKDFVSHNATLSVWNAIK